MNGWLGGENGNLEGSQRETRWLTPPYVVDSLGMFDLDPCGAPGHVLARQTYLLDDGQDGLTLPWFGRVWLNPPYGRQAEPFLARLAEHGCGTALLFARTETRMFHDWVWGRASSITFIRGRLTFLNPMRQQAKANAGAPSVLVHYGDVDTEAGRRSGLGSFVDLRNRSPQRESA